MGRRPFSRIRDTLGRASAPLHHRPDFLILGAMKAGTTSLFRYLAAHPRVESPRHKELHYFSTRFHHGPAWYRTQFPLRRPGRLTGESSPYYLAHPDAPRRAAAYVPEAKLIAILRDPAERAWSHFQYRGGTDPEDFALRLDDEEARLEEEGMNVAYDRQGSYLTRGLYARHLTRWLEYYPKEALRVLFFEEMKQEPAAVYRQACAHIGLDPDPLPDFKPHNVTRKKRPLPGDLRRRMDRFFERPDQELERLLGRPPPWRTPLTIQAPGGI